MIKAKKGEAVHKSLSYIEYNSKKSNIKSSMSPWPTTLERKIKSGIRKIKAQI